MGALLLVMGLWLLRAGEVRAQDHCIASPPITPVQPGWCTESHTPPRPGDHSCAQYLPEAVEEMSVNYRLPGIGVPFYHSACFVPDFVRDCGGPEGATPWVCFKGSPGCTMTRNSFPDVTPVDPYPHTATFTIGFEPNCKRGSEPYANGKCLDIVTKLNDEAAATQGLQYIRDAATGNLLKVVEGAHTLITFSGYDSFGRPTLAKPEYDPAVTIGWPADGTALPQYVITAGWKVSLTWEGDCSSARLHSVAEPTAGGGQITYTFSYFPDGHVHTINEHRGDKIYLSLYAETGRLVTIITSPASTTFAVQPAQSYSDTAAATAAPDPFFFRPIPKVPLGVPPGVPAGARMFFPGGFLIPLLGDMLARELGRAITNAHTRFLSSDVDGIQDWYERCGRGLRADYARCENAASKFGPQSSWPPDIKSDYSSCGILARQRYEYCLAHEGDMTNAPPMVLPAFTLPTREACEAKAWADYHVDTGVCDKLYPVFGGAESLICYSNAWTALQARLRDCALLH